MPDGYVVGEYNNPTVTDIEINMYGGTMGSNSGVFDGIKINKGERVNFNMHGGSISRMSFSGSNLNIHSGTIERLSAANELNHGDATQVNIYGGTVGDYASFASFDGRVVSINMTGGQIGNSLTVLNDSELTISGGTIGDDGDIQLNGKIILSGTGVIGDNLTLLSEKNASIPGTNQSILEVHGGTVGDNLTLERDSIVNMSGGVIGKNLTLKDNSVVNLTDGQIGDNVTLKHNSTFNFSGGFVGDDISIPNFKMEGDSVLNVFGHGFYPGVIQGNTTLDGGSGSEVNVYDSARINHDFTKNNGTVSVGDDAIVGPNFAMKIGDFTLGGNAIVDNDAHLDHVDSIISGGTIGAGLKLSSGNHTISGGSIGNGLFIRISDGVPGITPTRAPTVVIEGGQIGDNARVTSRTNCLPDCSTTQVTIQGGVIGDNFRIEGGELHLTGGTGFSNFTATGSSAIVNITADELYLNSIGNPLTTDDEGEYIERTGSLLVRFESDNTTDPMVSFDLSRFIRGSVLNLYFTPGNGGGTLIPGDLNGDGFVGIADLNLVLVNWNQNVPPGNPLADPSDDGYVGIDDLTLVLGNWNAGTPPQLPGANIPEPASAVVLVLLTTGRVGLRKHGRIAA